MNNTKVYTTFQDFWPNKSIEISIHLLTAMRKASTDSQDFEILPGPHSCPILFCTFGKNHPFCIFHNYTILYWNFLFCIIHIRFSYRKEKYLWTHFNCYSNIGIKANSTGSSNYLGWLSVVAKEHGVYELYQSFNQFSGPFLVLLIVAVLAESSS